MRQRLILSLIALVFISFQNPAKYFTGSINYKYQFKDAFGRNITDSMAKFIGREQRYFISGANYKSYDEASHLQQLYNGSTNTYYSVSKNKVATKMDGSLTTSKVFTVNRLKTRETVAGYSCNAVEIITDDATTIYYYTPAIRVNTQAYTNHNFGEFNKILKATNGALPLKFKMILLKQGFLTWISYATQVHAKTLAEDEFKLPADITIK